MRLLISLIAIFSLNTLFANVAKIGETEYASLDDAVSASRNGDTIELLADVHITSQIKVTTSKTITIDAKGCNVTSSLSALGSTAVSSAELDGSVFLFKPAKASQNINITFKDSGNDQGKMGTYNKISFTAISYDLNYPVTMKFEKGNFDGCSIYSCNFKSKVTIAAECTFNGGNIIARSLAGNTTYQASVEINGGTFNNVLLTLRPYSSPIKDTMSINSGFFNECTIKCLNAGANANLIVGGNVDLDEPIFEACAFEVSINYYSSEYASEVQIKRGSFSECNFKAYVTGITEKNFTNPSQFTITGGSFEDCKLEASLGSAKEAGKVALVIGGTSRFVGGRICASGASNSNYMHIGIDISGGKFENVLIDARESNDAQDVTLFVSGGEFNYCALYLVGASPNKYEDTEIQNATFKGCFIGSRAEFGYGDLNIQGFDIVKSSLFGCHLMVQNWPISSGTKNDSGLYSSLGKPEITVASDCEIVGVTSERKVCSDNEPTVDKPSAQASRAVLTISGTNEKVASIDGVAYTTLSNAFAEINKPLEEGAEAINAVTIQVGNDSYTPAVMSYGGGGGYSARRDESQLVVGSEKTVTIEGNNEGIIDSNFQVEGELILKGGIYTGSFSIGAAGVLCAAIGTVFENEPPEGLTFIGAAQLVQNEDGRYIVKERPGFNIILR